MKVAKAILVALLGIYILVIAAGFLLPKEMTLTRKVVIDAPKALVFDLVTSPEDFQRWSPWAQLDPNMEVVFSGPESGIGAKTEWSSLHPQVGSGESEYTVYEPYSHAVLKLSFEDGGGDAIFDLTETSEGVELVWSYKQINKNVFARYISFFMLEDMLGKYYEKGLEKLKMLAESMPVISTQEVSYGDGDTPLTGFLAQPESATESPVVLVVHEWWGHNDYVRERAVMLAELGYTAFAVDMYGQGKVATHPDDAKRFMMEVVSNQELLTARFDDALAYAKSVPGVDPEKTAVIGYCFGGAVALSMARLGKDLDGAVSFHGSLGSLPPVTEASVGPVLVLNGAADPLVPEEQIKAFEKEMTEAGKPYELINYEGAKHAFTSKRADAYGEKFGLPLAYDEEADEASWREMQAFLRSIF